MTRLRDLVDGLAMIMIFDAISMGQVQGSDRKQMKDGR
jgi:hypothetical protein